jgi:uncharacterized protein (DUF934 family)
MRDVIGANSFSATYFEAIRDPSGAGAAQQPTAASVMIKDRQVAPRRWTLVDGEGAVGPGAIVPLAKWQALEAAGADLGGVGIALDSDADAAVLKPYLAKVQVIALRFPSWKDGRAYSQARKLRHLWGYSGVLLAHGDVLRDQILWMSRVGFDALHLRDDQDPVASLRAFSLYTSFYQY